jgi:hypothetical protein
LERVRLPLLCYDEKGNPYTFQTRRPFLPKGMSCLFLIDPGNRWQAIVRGVRFRVPYEEKAREPGGDR